MTRVPALIIGLFLKAIWIAGLSIHTQSWLTWLDGAGALLAFGVAAMPSNKAAAEGRTVASAVLCLGLFALWIIALATHAEAWIAWCTFGAACAAAFVAFGSGGRAASSERRRLA